jgi:hypothetical protein
LNRNTGLGAESRRGGAGTFCGLARAREWWRETIWGRDKRGLTPPDIALGLELTSRAPPPDIALPPPELQLLLRLAAISTAALPGLRLSSFVPCFVLLMCVRKAELVVVR